jgi:hypothetical protein
MTCVDVLRPASARRRGPGAPRAVCGLVFREGDDFSQTRCMVMRNVVRLAVGAKGSKSGPPSHPPTGAGLVDPGGESRIVLSSPTTKGDRHAGCLPTRKPGGPALVQPQLHWQRGNMDRRELLTEKGSP